MQARLDPEVHIMTLSSPHAPSLTAVLCADSVPRWALPCGKGSVHGTSSATPGRQERPFPGPGPDARWTDLSHVSPCMVTVTFLSHPASQARPLELGQGAASRSQLRVESGGSVISQREIQAFSLKERPGGQAGRSSRGWLTTGLRAQLRSGACSRVPVRIR